MSDVFISYARHDEPVARRFAEALGSAGLDVWWDNALQTGEVFDEMIENALRAARAVVVLWSPHSVASRWVRAEATLADRNKTLLPVLVEPCNRPIIFELTQTANLTNWQGEASDAGWLAFLEDVRRMVRNVSAAPIVEAVAPAEPAIRLDQNSIVVLPFANMSRDEDQEYFADGISEDIITDLSKVSALSVIARNTAFTFKGKPVDVKQLASQLNVTHVLEGSVRKAGNRVRITAQLIDGSAGDHVWAERYDRDLDDIFALQDEISQAIVAALKLKLLPQEKQAIEDRGTDNVEAYDLYLRGQALARSFGIEEITRAIAIFREVVALDPNFAQGWYALGSALFRASFNAAGDPSEFLDERKQAYAKVVELAPDAWTTQLAHAMEHRFRREWGAAETALLKAAEGVPSTNLETAFVRMNFLSDLGRVEVALALARPTLRAEPLSLDASWVLQVLLYLTGRREEYLAEYERSKDLPGDRGIIEWWRMASRWDDPDPAKVRLAIEEYLPHETLSMPVLRELMDLLDDPDGARAAVRRALDDPHYQDSIRQNVLSHIAARFGEPDIALAAIRRSVIDMQAINCAWMWAPPLAKVRRDPRFKAIIRDLGIDRYWRATGEWGDFARPVGEDDFEIIA